MKKLLYLNLISIAAILLATACNRTGESNKEGKKEQIIRQIDSLEKEVYAQSSKTMLNHTTGMAIIKSYTDFANQFPNDSAAPGYLFKAGRISQTLQMAEPAIGYYKNVYEKYPTYSKAPSCLFLQGFIYETQLKNIEKAREIYKQFIEKYPNDPLAQDVKANMQYLGKSDEELIKELEAKNATAKES